MTDRLMTQKEYIIPLAFDSKSFSLFNKSLPANQQSPIREGISSLEQSVSIRPRVVIDRSAAPHYCHLSTFASYCDSPFLRRITESRAKVKEVDLCSAFIVVPHIQGAQIPITQFLPANYIVPASAS